MNRFLAAAVLAAAVSVATLPSTASANNSRQGGAIMDRGSHDRAQMLSVFGLVPWHDSLGFGAGVRYTLPIVDDGFIPPINDSFELEFGGDFAMMPFAYSSTYFWLAAPVVEARWTFHITPKFDAYAKLGVGLEMNTWNGVDFWFHHNEAAGVLFSLSDSLYLRGELGYTGPRVGLGFAF